MKRLLLKSILFLASLPVAYYASYRVLLSGHYWARTKNDPSSVYILSDSRAYHGIDVAVLSQKLGRKVIAHGTHGASAYTIYSMAELVPPGATVIVSPSLGMLFRERERVTYEGAISFTGMSLLYRYGFRDIWWYKRVFLENRYPFASPYFVVNPENLQLKDAPLSEDARFRSIYAVTEPPAHYEGSKKLLLAALEALLAKKCTVKVLEMPVSPVVAKMHAASIYGPMETELPWLADLPVERYLATQIESATGENIWYDLDHLNVRGRSQMTEWVAATLFKR